MLLRTWLERLRQKWVAGQRRRKPPQPVLETLENRTLMSVNPTAVTFTATEAAAFSGTVATFTSNDHSPQSASNYSATIDWGDGTVTSGAVNNNGSGFKVVAGHTYGDDGTENVKVTINDSVDHTKATVTSTANVAEQPLTLTTKAIEATEGTSFSGSLATFSDPGTSGDPDEYHTTIDWGDGHNRPRFRTPRVPTLISPAITRTSTKEPTRLPSPFRKPIRRRQR